jgi:hypothetical protein
MFEHRQQPLLSRAEFLRRQLKFTLIAFAIIFGSLIVGIIGYHFLEGFSWIDALLNSAMILGGMGPVNPLTTVAGKIFASFYALYSGIVFLVVAGVVFAPVFHRILHHFHLETEAEETNSEKEK